MLKVTIKIKAKTMGDVEMSIEEAHRLISEGFTSGGDRNNDAQFTIDVSGKDESEEDDD